MKRRLLAFIFLICGALTQTILAKLETKFYGYQWLRYSHVVLGKDRQSESQMLNPRTYLRWSMDDKEAGWKGRLTLDINNVRGGQSITVSSVTATVTPTDADGAGTTITVTHTHTYRYDTVSAGVDFSIWVKYAYVDFEKIPFLSDFDIKLRVGIQKNYFGYSDIWEYPLISAVLSDMRRIIPSSADMGIALFGDLPEGFGSYELAISNGNGFRRMETNIEKQYSASLMLLPLPGLMTRVSYMINNQAAHGTAAKTKRSTGLVGQYNFNGFFIPLPLTLITEYSVASDQAAKTATTSGVSVGYMFVGLFNVTEWLQIGARFDDWNPDTARRNDEMNLFETGINLQISENHLLQLNYRIDVPKYGGYTPDKHVNTWMSQLKWSW